MLATAVAQGPIRDRRGAKLIGQLHGDMDGHRRRSRQCIYPSAASNFSAVAQPIPDATPWYRKCSARPPHQFRCHLCGHGTEAGRPARRFVQQHSPPRDFG
jgi:hypothetical protein